MGNSQSNILEVGFGCEEVSCMSRSHYAEMLRLFGWFGAYASFTEELEDLTHHFVSPIHALVWYTQ